MQERRKQDAEERGGTFMRRHWIALCSTVLCVAIAHGFLFANEFFSHDSVSYFTYADWGFKFYIGVGRFLIPIYEACKGGVAAPWLIGCLFIVWMSLTGIVITDLLGINTPWGIALSCALLSTNISLTLTGATYVYCMDEYALALLGASAAAYLFIRGGRLSVLGLLPLCLSLSIYQPYATVTAALCLLALLRQTADGRRISVLLRRGCATLCLLLLGFACYTGLWALLRVLTQIPQTRDAATLTSSGLFARLVSANLMFFGYLFRRGAVLGWLCPAVHALLLLFLLWRLLRALTDGRVPLENRLFLLILACFTPTALYSVALVIPTEAHDLTAFARELFYLLPFCLTGNAPPRTAPQRTLSPASVMLCVLASLLLWHHVVYANQVYMKKELEKNSTLILAARIIDRIEGVNGYEPGKTRVAFAGRLDYNEPLDGTRDAFEPLKTQTGLWHSHAATYNLGRYLTDYLRYPILWEQQTNVTRSALVAGMPIFPAEGSVRMVDGIVVVKLSDT